MHRPPIHILALVAALAACGGPRGGDPDGGDGGHGLDADAQGDGDVQEDAPPPVDADSPEASPPDGDAESAPDGDTSDADADMEEPPCRPTLIPGRCEPGFDEDLAARARGFDRTFHAVAAVGNGLNASVVIDDPAHRALVDDFVSSSEEWSFEAATGVAVTDIAAWREVAGLYGGVGIAADAFRYGVLRDQGYPAEEVARARDHLLADLDMLHLAMEITGEEGVIARGFLRTDVAGHRPATVPLFDSSGSPLPEEKDNGTWREDNSGGLYPGYVWVDSCSRDMYVGWAAAFGAAWEVLRDDPEVPAAVMYRLAEDARALGAALRVVRASGFDLEIPDGDGRTTFHGYINEYNFERVYVPGSPIRNGFHAIMALGIVAALARASGDPALEAYLEDELIAARDLHLIARDEMILEAGPLTNFSGFNMAFTGAWLAARYIDDPAALAAVREALRDPLYTHPDAVLRPQAEGWGYSLFDLVYAAGMSGATALGPTTGATDDTAVDRALATLRAFHGPPYWDGPVENCSDSELDLHFCIAIDGTTPIVVSPVEGRGGYAMALTPLPVHLRPRSNYHWRSSPFAINGDGSPSQLLPAVDFRFAYWLGRFVLRAPPPEG